MRNTACQDGGISVSQHPRARLRAPQEFPSREAFFAFYNDPEYEPLKQLRLANTVGSMYLIDSDGPVDPLLL